MKEKKIKIKKRAGLRRTLFSAFAIFGSIILIILWLCQVVFLDAIYKRIKITEIEVAADKIVSQIDNENLEEYCKNVAAKNDLCILILQMQDKNTGIRKVTIHTQSECAIHNTDNYSKFLLYDATLNNNGRLLQKFRYNSETHNYYGSNDNFYKEKSNAPESIVYSVITTNKDGESMFVVLNSIISPVSATTRTLFYLLIVISTIIFIMSLLMAFIISRRISKPIVALNEGAKELAKRNYSVGFSENGYKEVAELGASLNYASLELSKVDELCRELIANISHDLRTPLTMITGYSEVMKDIPGENTPENIQIIIDEANRLTSLVNDVLDISRFQQGQTKFIEESFNLTEEVRNATMRYGKLMAKDGYSFDFINETGEDITVYSDKTRLLQVFYNLVNNAITYTGEDKKVIIRQIMSGEFVRIEITDSGDGIPPEKLPLIWDRYYRVDSFHKRAAVGTGLGLSIVKKIMDLAHGKCGVRSKLGEGSTFYFEIKKAE